jgi:hypothetical protein
VHRLLERGKMEAKVIIYKTETYPFVKGAREGFSDKGIYMPCAYTKKISGRNGNETDERSRGRLLLRLEKMVVW